MMRKHPEVSKKGSQIDMSDILADPVIVFEEKLVNILLYILILRIVVLRIISNPNSISNIILANIS